VEQAGMTMTEVVSSIHRVTGIMGDISTASVEQSAGIEQVNRAIADMDAVTQQNAALVEEAAAAAAALGDQAAALARPRARQTSCACAPDQSFKSAGTLPPLAASLFITCRCSQIFIDWLNRWYHRCIVQFLRKFLARLQAAVDIQQFHQVHNRGAPVQRLAGLLRFRIQDGFHIDHLHRGGRRCGSLRRRRRSGRRGSRCRRSGLRGYGRMRGRKNLSEDIVQNAHWVLLEVQ
jgi:hypothetical protein